MENWYILLNVRFVAIQSRRVTHNFKTFLLH